MQFTKTFSNLANAPDFLSAATLGLVAGCQLVFAVGHVSGVAVITPPIDIWDGANIYPFQTTAGHLNFSSSSANDAAPNSGAWACFIQGLDANFNQISETVSLAGTGTVSTVNQYRRVNGVAATVAGSGGTNAGTITVATAGATTLALIEPGLGVSQSAVYTVPAGYYGILQGVEYALAGANTNVAQAAITANVFSTAFGNGQTNTARAEGTKISCLGGTPVQSLGLKGYANPPETDLTCRLLSCGQASTEISAAFSLLLVASSYVTSA